MTKRNTSKKVSTQRKRTRLTPDIRRTQLLNCAIESCAENGLLRAAHADIAERADVAVATVFSYFKTREILIDSVLNEVASILSLAIESATKDKAAAPDQLVEMVWHCATLVHTRPSVMRVWLDWTTAISSPIWPKYLKFQNDTLALFTRIIRKGKQQGLIDERVRAGEAARVIVGESHMLAMLLFEGADDEQTRKFIRHYVLMACHYVEH